MSLALAMLIALALGGIAAFAAARALVLGYPPRVLAESSLSRREQAVVAACADALFPAGGPIPISGTEAGLVRYFDGYVQRCSRKTGGLVRLLLAFIEFGPYVFGPRHTRFTRLSRAEQVRALADMAESGVYLRRISFLSVRTMLSMGYLANERVARAIGMRCDLAPFELARRAAERPPSVPPPAGVAA